MTTTFTSEHPAVQLTTQGIQAIKAGHTQQAYIFLTEALEHDQCNEQAWLWLSGAVTTDNERRYCLEQVLALNPQHPQAQRGLALLPATATAISPLRDEFALLMAAPTTPSIPTEGIFTGTTAKLTQPEAAAIEAVPVFQPVLLTPVPPAPPAPLQLPSLWGGGATLAEPATHAPAQSVAVPFGTDSAYKQADVDFVLKSFSKHYDRNQIARLLSEQRGYNWDTANAMVAHVETRYSTKVAARQLPLYLGLGIVTLLVGLGMMGRSGMALYFYYQHPMVFNPRLFVVFGTGVVMMLGSMIGIGQSVRNLWKK